MSGLFDRLVSDEGTWIEPASQRVLARWFYKTALMVSTTMDHEAANLPRHHYADLAGTLDLPPASFVWAGLLADPRYEVALWVQRFEWWDKQAVPPVRCEGFSFAVSVFDLAALVVVFDLRQSPESDDMNPIRPSSRVQEKLVRVWPPHPEFGLKWPPPAKLTVGDLEDIRRAMAELDKQPGA